MLTRHEDPVVNREPAPSALVVAHDQGGLRIDILLKQVFPQYSRAQMQKWIKEGCILVDGRPVRTSHVTRPGEKVEVRSAGEGPTKEGGVTREGSPIALEVLYEDDSLLVVNKPRGLVVHPGSGVASGTLAQSLVARGGPLSTIGGSERPGIVHRLDKETSGVLLIAKTDEAHIALTLQFRERTLEKRYLALVNGVPRQATDRIETAIGRHPVHRKKMSVSPVTGRKSITEYYLRGAYEEFAFLEVLLHTGRTHQIRVHLAHVGHPVVGDPVYGGRKRALNVAAGMKSPALVQALTKLTGQALHAHSIVVGHPVTGRRMRFEAPLPFDITHLVQILRQRLEGEDHE
ncbi:MAG: RluA family pseudouridine synthase [Armatimonadetes bacterium]|nr:RluA family pseudouridine synthase [Armatimonadota bacterium]